MQEKTYSEWLDTWLEYKKNFVKESTYANYKTAIRVYIAPALGDLNLTAVTESVIQAMTLQWLKHGKSCGTGLAISTVKDFIMIIKSSLRAAHKSGMIDATLIDISFPRNYNPSRPEILTKEYQAKIVQSAYLNLNTKSMGILLCLATGLRIGELCGLRWSDIDLANETLSVERTLQRIYNPSSVSATKIVITSPKTISSRRIIPLSSAIIPVLRRFECHNDNYYILSGTELYIEPRTYRSYYADLLKRSDVPHINFHSLRHTFATRLIENGADCKSVSMLLGHSSVNMTLNLYVHPQLEQQRSTVELFNLVSI